MLGEPNLDPGGGVFSRKVAAMSEADYVARGHDGLVRAARLDGNDIWAASLSLSAPFAVHRGASSLVAGSNPTWRDMLYKLQIRRTIIFGESFLPDNPDAKRLPQVGVNVGVVPGAGHSMAWENPAGLASAVRHALP